MAEGDQTKAERKQARAGAQTKAERKQARAGRMRGAGGNAPGADASLEERIEFRLASIEEAVAIQSERSDQLLEKVDAMLQEASESAAEPNAPQPDAEGD